MTQPTLAHATLVMERTYKASPKRVFHAWESVEARERWSPPTPDIKVEYIEADFREGGRDLVRCAAPGSAVSEAEVTYLDIRRDSRLVFAESVNENGKRVAASLISVELTPVAEGTHLQLTLQIASFDGAPMEEGYKFGWSAALDNLANEFS